MTKKIVSFLLALCVVVGSTGCSLGTSGKANWEMYAGVRHEKVGEEEAKVEIKSTVVDKIVDLFTGPEKKEDK